MKARILKYKISKKIPRRPDYPVVSKKALAGSGSRAIPNKIITASIESQGDDRTPVGLNRMVVAGFCAIRNLKEILIRSEHERGRLSDCLNEFIAVVTEIVRDRGGIAEKFHENGILFFFGAEGAKTDDFISILIASLKIRYRMNKLNRAWNLYHDDTWKIGVGITAGNTYVMRSGPQRQRIYSIKGELPLFAMNLGRSAGNSQIVITEDMYNNPLFPKKLFEVKNPFHLQVQGMDRLTRVREVIALIKDSELI